jgi:hypothetical protein
MLVLEQIGAGLEAEPVASKLVGRAVFGMWFCHLLFRSHPPAL